MDSFSEDELSAIFERVEETYNEVKKAEERGPGEFTALEWAHHHRLSVSRARELLLEMVRKGVLSVRRGWVDGANRNVYSEVQPE